MNANIISIISSAAPLLLAATGALFSEYAGILAMFLEGLISFSAFIFYAAASFLSPLIPLTFFTVILSMLICIAASAIPVFLFSRLFERTNANIFIASIGMNLFFASLTSLLSSIIFKTRGVLYSTEFNLQREFYNGFSIVISITAIAAALVFLLKTRHGLYIRITGSDPQVLKAKGISDSWCRTAAWTICAVFGAMAGCLLSMRISSFVPNISSGRGWMALAAVFLGKRKLPKITIATFLFCAADYFSSNIQNYLPSIPSPVLLSFPYFIAILLIAVPKPYDRQ